MKKLAIVLILLIAVSAQAYAQECWIGKQVGDIVIPVKGTIVQGVCRIDLT